MNDPFCKRISSLIMAAIPFLTKKQLLLTFILTGFITTGAFAQYFNNLVRIDSSERSYRFFVTNEKPKPRLSYTYFWFTTGRVHKTNGGYNGKLLHGEYKVTDREQRLLEQGNFRMGQRSGTWYTWYPNGKLQSITRYRLRKTTQRIEEYDAQGNWLRKGHIRNELFTGKQQEQIKDSAFVVRYKNGIRQQHKNSRR